MKQKKLRRGLALLLSVAMVFSMGTTSVFATEGGIPIGASSIVDSGTPAVCEHTTHDEACGYREAVEGVLCAHLNEDGSYSCVPAVSGNEATPSDAETVCDHSDDCGYIEAVEGADCTHTCELCKPTGGEKPAQPEIIECDCTVQCVAPDANNGAEAAIKADCPVCGIEASDLAACKGEQSAPLTALRSTDTEYSFTFANQTGVDAVALYTSSASNENWGTTLGKVDNNASLTVTVAIPSGDTAIDVQLQDSSGAEYEFHKIDISKAPLSGGTITLTIDEDSGSPKATTSWENDTPNGTKITTAIDLSSKATNTDCTKTTSDGGNDHVHSDSATKCWTWDSGTTTLTLNNLQLETTAYTALKLPANATVTMGGISTVTSCLSDYDTCGIYGAGALTFNGSGTLTATGSNGENNRGVSTKGNIIVSSGTLNAIGDIAELANYGAYTDSGDIIVFATGTLNATGGQSFPKSYGAYTNSGNITVSDTGTLNATGGAANESYGAYTKSGDITVSGGTFEAKTTGTGTAQAVNKAPVTSGYTNVKLLAGTAVGSLSVVSDLSGFANYKHIKIEQGTATSNVAEITKGDTTTGYATLTDAVTAVTEGDTIKLNAGVTENIVIPSNNTFNFTLDLNGKTLNGGSTGAAISHAGSGTLTIKDSGTGGMVTATSTDYTIYNKSTGTINVLGGKVTSTSSCAIYNNSTGKINVSDGEVTSSRTVINNNSGGTVTVSGGTVASTGSNAVDSTGKVIVSGGEVSSTSSYGIYASSGTIEINGVCVIKGGNTAMNKAPTLDGVTLTASTNVDGTNPVAYNAADIATYKYIKAEAATGKKITTTLDFTKTSANGGMSDKTSCADGSGHTTHTGTPCWAWDNAANTLTLNNVDVDLTGTNASTAIVLGDGGKIVLKGNNAVRSGNATGRSSEAINCHGALDISGDGTLEATASPLTCDSEYSVMSIGISSSGKLTISGGTVTVTSGDVISNVINNRDDRKSSRGIWGYGGVSITGGTVTATSGTVTSDGTNKNSYGILSDNPIELSGGTVTAKAVSENYAQPFSKQPTLTGMVLQSGAGAWNNKTGAACTYEKSAPATVTAVAVTPKTASVQQGNTQQFGAAVTGTNNPAQTVTWEVTGGKSGTGISASGLLTVAADETATSLAVKATSTVDTAKSDTVTVTVTTTPVTKYALTVTGGTGSGSFEENATVTITANAPATGKVFDKWTTTDGVTFADANAATTTITMPAKAVTVTATYKDQAVTVPATGVTLNKSTISLYRNTNPRSETLTATVAPANATNKAVTWSSSNTAVATVANGVVTAVGNGTATITVTTTDGSKTATCAVTVSTYTSGGSTGGGGGGGSSSGGGSTITVTPPAPNKPNDPTKVETKVPATVDKDGKANVSITDKAVTDAINKAVAEAKKNGDEANGITLILNVTTGGKTATNVTVNLPKTVQEKVISEKIVSTVVVVDQPDVKIGMDLATMREINRQANADVNITAARKDNGKLTGEAKTAIGNRPVFDLSVNYGSGKTVSSFGAGSVSVALPYTLQAGEKAGNVYAVYVDAKGKVSYITGSSYDTVSKSVLFSTNHFSTYGVGYKADAPSFTDIANHWAKADIEFVAARGLLTGTSTTTFSPNNSMTRGMFVTALGRMAGIDTSSYKNGKFTDVKADAYYAPYVNWAASKGITGGTTATTFAPNQAVTRQEMAVFMTNYAKAMGYTLPKTRVEVTFADSASIGSWAAEAVKAMQMAGVIMGKDGNRFDPTGTATRAEVTAVLHRYVELVIDRTTAQGLDVNDSGKIVYYENGKLFVGTKTIDGTTYHFGSDGICTKIDAVVPDTKKYTIHKIVYGDTLWDIAVKNKCTVAEIVGMNGIKDPNNVPVGTELKIPQK